MERQLAVFASPRRFCSSDALSNAGGGRAARTKSTNVGC